MHDSRSRWDVAAPSYLHSSWHGNEAALEHMLEVAKPDGGVLLDIATGAGHAALTFAPHVDSVAALDSSTGMLAVARAEALRRGIDNIEFVEGDALRLPFSGESLDGILCRVAAHHFADPEGFLAECFRVLVAEGYLLLIDTIGIEHQEADDELHRLESLRDPSHVRNYTTPLWMRMARKAGFAVEYEESYPKPLNAKEWMDRMSVEGTTRAKIVDIIESPEGWLREYLLPHGEGDLLTFHLMESTMLLRK
jgi:ubiquinone/menaquinone biosynthesis C-methylase UbiE